MTKVYAMKRVLAFIYGAICYLVFFLSFVYAIGFIGNLVVPKSIDSGAASGFWPSLFVNLGLLALFGLQHSGMARPGFKRWWTKIVPQPVERSTYVLFASLALILLMALWQPMPTVVWNVDGEAGQIVLWTLYGLGWGLVLAATFMISHAHLFGVKQVHEYLNELEPSEPGFQTPGLYRYIRHPILAGFFITFWATPRMTAGHLVFALATTGYILVAVRLEERDLIAVFGEKYRKYRRRVPMLIPWPGKKEPIEERA